MKYVELLGVPIRRPLDITAPRRGPDLTVLNENQPEQASQLSSRTADATQSLDES